MILVLVHHKTSPLLNLLNKKSNIIMTSNKKKNLGYYLNVEKRKTLNVEF